MIDDGSSDGTAAVARAHGVDHVIRFRTHKGLAAAFMAGLDAAVRLGADYIVNTDADNQYAGKDIAALVRPLLDGTADIVIGDRNVATLRRMPPLKRWLQRLGSWVVRRLSNTRVPDATSGFRAYTREAALRQTVVSDFSYTLETIIQAGRRRMAVAHVPVATNDSTRPSRLFDSVFTYIRKSAATIVRIYTLYEPLTVFTAAGLTLVAGGLAISLRFLYFYMGGAGSGHVQVAHPGRRAADRRLPGAADRPAGRRALRQPQADRGAAVPGAHPGSVRRDRDAGDDCGRAGGRGERCPGGRGPANRRRGPAGRRGARPHARDGRRRESAWLSRRPPRW